MNWLSGDQNILYAPSVPGSASAWSVSSDRIHRRRPAVKASRRPSGDSLKYSILDFSGGGIWKILEEAGYDPATKLIYFPSPGLRFPCVPAAPCTGQIDWARGMIEELIGDFPFADAASKTNAIAALLTPIVRPLIPGPTPLALLDAPMPGTGKGLLAECIGLVATGRSAPLMTAPDSEDEWRKRITATLLEGDTLITIDNLEGKLESASVASVLTSPTWKGRILGVSKTAELPQRASWLATGNNIVLGGDLPRRCYLIRIDAKTSKPWERTGWLHPELRQWVADHRGELIGALLMLVRSWCSSGCPDYLVPRLGSFESWCGTVGNILAHAGYAGFLANKEDLYQNNDSDGGQWEAFLKPGIPYSMTAKLLSRM